MLHWDFYQVDGVALKEFQLLMGTDYILVNQGKPG